MMPNNKIFLPLTLSTFLFSAAAQASNPYFELYNDNQQAMGNFDAIQFKIYDADRATYAYSKEISAQFGTNYMNMEFLAFSGRNDFTIYVRDVTRNSPYQQCGSLMERDSKGRMGTIYGSSNGTEFKCVLK